LYAFTLTCANAGTNKNPSLFWFETIHHLVFVAPPFQKRLRLQQAWNGRASKDKVNFFIYLSLVINCL
jgi:hypothetical protein